MCTSLTLETKDKNHFLARTMDFSLVLNPSVIMYPRNHQWNIYKSDQSIEVKYAFLGVGQKFSENYCAFADGVNEKGLSCASLYFPGYASYSDKKSNFLLNIAPYEIVPYLLSKCETIEDAIAEIKGVNLMNTSLEEMQLLPPLHWIVYDKSGGCIVIEPRESGLEIIKNPIGVMTNSPEIDWHLTNLRNYIGLNPFRQKDVTLANVTFKPISQGSGSFGLPGDFTSPSRFVKTVFAKHANMNCENETEGLSNIFHILEGVTIPKGNVVTEYNRIDYTQYTACFNLDKVIIYYKTYDNSQIEAVSLLNENLNASGIKLWDMSFEQNIKFKN